jgi:hypothetical protein
VKIQILSKTDDLGPGTKEIGDQQKWSMAFPRLGHLVGTPRCWVFAGEKFRM